jgi:tRNA threonylcarbamoyl adenosine modification protein YeaZ
VRDGDILWQGFHDGATDHGNAVADLVKQALSAGVNPDRVVVGMGPGPFTGLRVGISFARAFAAARNIEVLGICSLDAIVVDLDEYTVAIDARRKEIYWATYKSGSRVEGPAVNFPTDVDGYIIDRYPDITRMVRLSADHNYTEPLYLRRPDAVATADRT